MNLTFRQSTYRKIPAYAGLFQRAFPKNKKFTERYLQWLYRDNPEGTLIGYDAYHGGSLVAHYGCVPRKCLTEGGEALCLHSVNTATDPDYTRRGLFTRLAEITYQTARQKGFSFVFGVANKNSISGFKKKLGFDLLGNVQLGVMRPFMPPAVSSSFSRSTQWLTWRLKNPSQSYYSVAAGNARQMIFCRRGGAAIVLGEVNAADLSLYNVGSNKFPPLLQLVPTYPSMFSLAVPNKLLPSPWYVIAKSLCCDSCPEIRISGLDLDSF